MGLNEIKQLVATAFQAGRYDAQIDMGLRSDKIRRKQAEMMLKSRGFTKSQLDKWVDSRLVKEYVGDSTNSPRMYSLRDINEMLTSVSIKRMYEY